MTAGPDAAEPAALAPPAPDSAEATAERLAACGLTRADAALLNRVAFAAAARGETKPARAIAAAMRELAPDHASWTITEYLCLMAERRRDAALAMLERDGLSRPRAWEQAAELLLSELDPAREADRRAPIEERLRAAGLLDETSGEAEA